MWWSDVSGVPVGSVLAWSATPCGSTFASRVENTAVSSPALVSGNLIHWDVSVSQRCRMMAWSGGMAELGGVARYHVGGIYPSSHSAMVMPGGFWFKAFCLSVACWSGGTYRPGCSICPTSVQQL